MKTSEFYKNRKRLFSIITLITFGLALTVGYASFILKNSYNILVCIMLGLFIVGLIQFILAVYYD